MEAEIIALARCCCKLLPVMDIVKEKGDAIGLATKDLTTIHVSMHEENTGILDETNPPEFTPRCKYNAIITVCFCEES